MQGFYDIKVTTIDGKITTLATYKDKVLLIVNVASKCGFTDQYDGLEKLYKKYWEQGFVVLGFPCNQFAAQEPGTEEEILNFCRLNYGVTFPMFAKIDVNGSGTHPLYTYLKAQSPGVLGSKTIKWNFTKFLVARGASSIQRFSSSKKVSDLEGDVVRLLK